MPRCLGLNVVHTPELWGHVLATATLALQWRLNSFLALEAIERVNGIGSDLTC